VESSSPSRTAQGAAMHRALHQLIDQPLVFEDPLALAIIGAEAASMLREGRDWHGFASPALRAFLVARSRFAEASLREAVARGVDQYVLLGAGLDTFAYRNPFPRLTVFEIDHPATQGWKRERLAEAGIRTPPGVVFGAADFERETLREVFARAGFDFAKPGFVAWLGVVPYLTHEAVSAVLAFTGSGLKAGSEIVFDYPALGDGEPAENRASFAALATRVAEAGEPFRSAFAPDTLAKELHSVGFTEIADLDSSALNARYFDARSDGLRVRGLGHLLKARI
jgi:methyltransferase (TIGR00027 family)